MALITIRRRTATAGLAVPIAAAAAAQVVGYGLFGLANAVAAQFVWRHFAAESRSARMWRSACTSTTRTCWHSSPSSARCSWFSAFVSPRSFGAVSGSPCGGSEHPGYSPAWAGSCPSPSR
jgi:hypothetical protein